MKEKLVELPECMHCFKTNATSTLIYHDVFFSNFKYLIRINRISLTHTVYGWILRSSFGYPKVNGRFGLKKKRKEI